MIEFVPKKRQKFNIGRTINPFLCDCSKCDFLHCPKNNYAVEMERKKYSVKEWFEKNKKELIQNNLILLWQTNNIDWWRLFLTYHQLTDFFDTCVKFPKNIYWNTHVCDDCTMISDVEFYKFVRGKEVLMAELDPTSQKIKWYNYQDMLNKFVIKVRQLIGELKQYINSVYIDEKWICGWISPEGRFYRCKNGYHSKICDKLGFSEACAERDGWVKVIDNETYFGTYLTAEQRNWLSMNGFEVD